MPFDETGTYYDPPPPPGYSGAGGGASGGTGVPDPYYAPPEPGEWFNPFTGPPAAPPYVAPSISIPSPPPGGSPIIPELPPTSPDRTLEPYPPSGGVDYYTAASWWGPLFKQSRKGGVRTPSPAQQLIKTGIDSVFRGARSTIDYFKSAEAVAATKTADIVFGKSPGVGFWARRLIGGTIAGALFELAFPNELDSGELPAGFLQRGQPLAPGSFPPLSMDPRADEYVNRRIGIDKQFPLGRESMESIDKMLLQVPTMPNAPEVEPQVQKRGRSGIEKYLEDRARNAARRALPPQLRQYVPRSSIDGPIARDNSAGRNVPQVAPPQPGAVVQQTVPASRSSSGRSPRARRIFQFGTLGTLALLIEANRRGGGSSSPGRAPTITPEPFSPVTPDPATPPLPIPTPGAAPSVSPYYGIGGGGGSAYCTPRPRGPRRKCLERAPVKYSGGRRKGSPAGSKCLRWEAPKR